MMEWLDTHRIGPIDDDPQLPIAANSVLGTLLPHRKFMHRGTVFLEQWFADGCPSKPNRRKSLEYLSPASPANE